MDSELAVYNKRLQLELVKERLKNVDLIKENETLRSKIEKKITNKGNNMENTGGHCK